MRKRLFAAALLAMVAAPLLAAPADDVRIRVAGLRELGAAFKNVSDGVRGDLQVVMVQQSAREIVAASRAQYRWFPRGSGPQPGLKTAAKAEIWTRGRQFRAAQNAFARQAVAFQRVAARGDAAEIRTAFRSLGGTCKGCHDNFRVPPAN